MKPQSYRTPPTLITDLISLSRTENIHLAIIGPEVPLVEGISEVSTHFYEPMDFILSLTTY